MKTDILEVNSIEEARKYAEHIIAYVDSHVSDEEQITVPVGACISAQLVNSEVLNALIDSHLNHSFNMRTFYGPDGSTAVSKEVLITLTRK